MRSIPIVLLFTLFAAALAQGHESLATKAEIALEEKLGAALPADAMFLNQDNKPINLRQSVDVPTIIAPVYLSCVHECPLLLTGLARALGKLDSMVPGKDFKVVTISFDDRDTPAISRDKKPNYLKSVGRPFPAEAWQFLTSDNKNIRKFTDSIGFRFQQDGEHDFSHPITLVVVSSQGTIVRYLEGTSFLPFEMTMALTEAAEGRVSSTTRKALLYCYSYDPLKKSYVFNILKVAGTVMVLFVGGFLAYLMLSGRKKEQNP
jgi:protein SCO1/2